MRTNYVITIARNFGAGGKSVGMALSKELGIPCYERQILAMASEKSGIDEKLFVDMDERLNGGFLAKKLAAMPFSTVLEPREKEFTSDNNLFNIQADIIQTMARSESFIVIGKCADFVLRPYGNAVSYTHLDVYKRQGVLSAKIMGWLELAISPLKRIDRKIKGKGNGK